MNKMNIFKTIIFLQKEITRQLKDKNHDVVKVRTDKKVLKHYQNISLKRTH